MTIDFWGLGLQAVNVLILIWLLSRVFWRPVAAAIATRQEAARAVTQTAAATQAKADAALAEVTQARAEMARERNAMLEAAREEAETATKATLAEAKAKAEAILAAAVATIRQNTQAAQKADAEAASNLALTIAAHLLGALRGPIVQSAFLAQLVEAIAKMPAEDRAALVDDPTEIEVVSAEAPTHQSSIETAIHTALGGKPALRFTTDPALIAGLELRGPHFVLHNSWQADLAQVQKAVKDAA